MQYDAKHFKKSANNKVLLTWMILGIVLSGAYVIEIVKGLRTMGYYIQFLSLCWIPFILGFLILRFKASDSDAFKYIAALGYGTFYVFILMTTTSPLAFVYIFPLTSTLTLYKNRNFMIQFGAANLVVLGISIVRNIQSGLASPSDITQYEIQIACTILCFMGYILSINYMNSSEGAMMSSMKENLDTIVNTVEAVKVASNDIVDGVSAVMELADENIVGAKTVVTGMVNLTSSNTDLQHSTASSLTLTESISTQVQNVASMIGEMVELANESTSHAKVSSEELSDIVTLSIEVEQVLREFKSQFKTMTNEIDMIESITMQTNILSLNASVEAARAGAAGKGFAVVAGEIKELSSKTRLSSGSIFTALQHLENTSNKMTESITKTLEKVKQVDQSVKKITADTTQMGDNSKSIDSAITEVKSSNTKLVENMHDVSRVVALMTESIVASEETTKAMLNKSIETTKNVSEVEAIVGTLMENLGVVGVVGIRDIKPGQLSSVIVSGMEYKVRIAEILTDGAAVEFLQGWTGASSIVCDFAAAVDSSYYKWVGVRMTVSAGGRSGKIELKTPPTVSNRRQYNRVPLNNSAFVIFADNGYVCHGQMINISEGGYAFQTSDPRIAGTIHQSVSLHIDNFIPFKDHELDAKVIRVGQERQGYSIGCRFLEDNFELRSALKNSGALAAGHQRLLPSA